MTEQKVLKAKGIGELVGAVTALLGYTPTQSLVIAPFVGSRANDAMRVDLITDPELRPALVAQVMGLTCRMTGVTGFAARRAGARTRCPARRVLPREGRRRTDRRIGDRHGRHRLHALRLRDLAADHRAGGRPDGGSGGPALSPAPSDGDTAAFQRD